MGHDVDLALLTVEDESFWEGAEGPMKPLKLGDVPKLQVGPSFSGFSQATTALVKQQHLA